MESIRDPEGIAVATRMAVQTSDSKEAMEATRGRQEKPTLLELTLILAGWPVQFAKKKAIPFYRSARTTLKQHMTTLLFGQSPYACKIRMTGINLMVLFSFIYLFLEVIALAFLPARADFAVAVVGR